LRAGNGFGEGFKRDYAQQQLVPGRILYLYCRLETATKDKFMVLAAVEPSPLLLVINSRIPRFIQGNPSLRACQVCLRASEYDFLDHDSYVNCTQVLDGISLEAIVEQFADDVSRLKGELTAADRAQISAAVRRAPTVSPAHKQAVEAALVLLPAGGSPGGFIC